MFAVSGAVLAIASSMWAIAACAHAEHALCDDSSSTWDATSEDRERKQGTKKLHSAVAIAHLQMFYSHAPR